MVRCLHLNRLVSFLMFVPQSSPIRTYPRSRRCALPPSSRSRLSSTTCSSLPSSSTNRRCRAFVPLVIFYRAPVAQRPHADQPTEFRQRPKHTVASSNVPRRRSSCSGRQTGMSRSCHFRSPSPTTSMQPLYAARLPELVTRGNASRTPRGGLVFFFTCCVSVQDTGRYEGHIFTGPHRLPTRDGRYSRETPTAADAHDGGAGRLRLLHHCWIVLRSAVILCHV
jgi:hypothetical protein